MSVRNCGELGKNLQKIIFRLLANDNLVKLLYYEDLDPLSKENLTTEQKQKEIFEKLIKITPRVLHNVESNQSIVLCYINSGTTIPGNSEFRKIQFVIEVKTPLEQWIIKDSNLRPFAILGEIQSSLNGKTINGLGKIEGGDFRLSSLTDKMSVYSQVFSITEYD